MYYFSILVAALLWLGTPTPTWAANCKALQVSCLPELGLWHLQSIYYPDTNRCAQTRRVQRYLHQQGIYPLNESGLTAFQHTCTLNNTTIKLSVNSAPANSNPQGVCGAFGPIAEVSLTLGGTPLLKAIPIETCHRKNDHTIDAITLKDESDHYSLQFLGNDLPPLFYFTFHPTHHTLLNQPATLELPLTQWSIYNEKRE